MTIQKLYLGDAFGWENEQTATVAISQLREQKVIDCNNCPKAQLVKNGSHSGLTNSLKFLGYIPGINYIAGALAIGYSSPHGSKSLGPNHQQRWVIRGITMIIFGPLLAIVDLIKFIADKNFAAQYYKDHPKLVGSFNVDHDHTLPYWPGHPISCKIASTSDEKFVHVKV